MKTRLGFLFGSLALGATVAFAELNVLCTTFPVHQIARNVVQGREGVALQLMLPAGMGCPHDYALTPQDMRKLASADVLVVNGLGLEEFLDAPVLAANPGIEIVDSSAGIRDLLEYAHDPHEAEDEHGHEDHATGFDENGLVSAAQENRCDGWQTGGEGIGWQGRYQGCARCWRCHFRGDNLCDV